MDIIKRIKTWQQKRHRKRALLNVRKEFAFYGFDLSDLSDEEVEYKCQQVASVISKLGVSCEVVQKNLLKVFQTAIR